jgi:hypothetical protein
MMFQRGPGEGYGAAKAEVLAIDPSLRCYNASDLVGRPYFVVMRGGGPGVGKRIGEGGRLARDAWGDALAKLQRGSDHA